MIDIIRDKATPAQIKEILDSTIREKVEEIVLKRLGDV